MLAFLQMLGGQTTLNPVEKAYTGKSLLHVP